MNSAGSNFPIGPNKPSADDVAALILSFNDANLTAHIFMQLGWTLTDEIKETLNLAKQNTNLSVKLRAIQHLHKIMQDTAETSGMLAQVSQTVSRSDGGRTTFSAKRLAQVLNPKEHTKYIESNNIRKEVTNEETRGQEIPLDRGSSRREEKSIGFSQESNIPPPGDTGRNSSKGVERSADGKADIWPSTSESESSDQAKTGDTTNGDEQDNPCILHKPPTCEKRLFPGVSGGEHNGGHDGGHD